MTRSNYCIGIRCLSVKMDLMLRRIICCGAVGDGVLFLGVGEWEIDKEEERRTNKEQEKRIKIRSTDFERRATES